MVSDADKLAKVDLLREKNIVPWLPAFCPVEHAGQQVI
jgi:hypothetical protein